MSAKDEARKRAEKRRLDALAEGKRSRGKRSMNAPGQEVHGEERVHQENTDRDMDDLYTTEGDNEILEWRRHSDLEAPPPRAGYVNRFIRIRLGTVRDTARLRNALREGWRPVKASSVSDRSLPTISLDQFGEVIGVEDLILCEMPERTHQQRQKFYRNKGVSQEDASGFGPIVPTRRTTVTRRPPNVEVADD